MPEIIGMFCTKMLQDIAIAISEMLQCNIRYCKYPISTIAKMARY